MKNLFKVFGIIALIAIVGFSFAACNMGNDDTTNNNNQQTQAPDVTFTLSDGTAGDNKYEVTVSGAEWGTANIHALMESDVQNLETVIIISSDKKRLK